MSPFYRKKLSSFVRTQDWNAASNYVAKRYMDPVDENVYRSDVILQMDAKLWGEHYNRSNPPKKVSFIFNNFMAVLSDLDFYTDTFSSSRFSFSLNSFRGISLWSYFSCYAYLDDRQKLITFTWTMNFEIGILGWPTCNRVQILTIFTE